jgi:hypothetical protein
MNNREELKQVFLLRSTHITQDFLHRMFNTGNKNYVEASEPVVLDEALMKEAESELNLFKNIKELYGTTTTFGRIVFNLVLYNIKDVRYEGASAPKDVAASYGLNPVYDKEIKPMLTFKNEPQTAGNIEKCYKEMAELLIDGKITAHAMNQFIDNLNWLGFTLVPYMTPSMDILSMSPTSEVKRIRNAVFKEHKDIIADNDVVAYNNIIEPQILQQAGKVLDEKGSTGKIIFDSGVNGSFNGNYKITAVARGVVARSDDNTQYQIATSSLVEGVSKKEVGIAGDIAVQGSLGRAIDTRQGGYKVKQFYAGFQSVVADVPGTDCGTPYTIDISLDDKNYSDYLYRYVVEGNKFVLLDRDNKSRYIGKKVKMRTPFFCQTPKICNKCCGEMIYKLGIKNIGLTSANIGSALLNASLKAFHSLSVKTNTYNIEDFMSEL